MNNIENVEGPARVPGRKRRLLGTLIELTRWVKSKQTEILAAPELSEMRKIRLKYDIEDLIYDLETAAEEIGREKKK